MKNLANLIKRFEEWEKNIDNQVIEAQRKTAEQVWEDIIAYAPVKNGDYIASINIEDTQKDGHTISTFIGSDMKVGPTKWTGGKEYLLGYLLENGTFEHAIPNAFGRGFTYGYTDAMGRYHKGTLDRDWHPGTLAQPHYELALEKNRKLYKDNIMKVILK